MNNVTGAEKTALLINKPQISWGAVFGGWIIAYGIAMLLYTFGAAVGFTTMDALNNLNMGVALGTAVWMLIVWAASMYIGGLFAGRLAGPVGRGAGAMHGMIVWALSGILTVFVGLMQLGGLAATGAAVGSNIMQAGASAAQGAGGIQLPQNVQNQLTQQASQILAEGTDAASQAEINQSLQQMDSQAWTGLAGALLGGNTQQATNILAQNTTLSEQQINQLANQLGAQAQPLLQQAGGIAGQAAETATDYTNTALWVLFLCSLAGLFAGAFGGISGAKRAAKYYSGAGGYGEPQYHPAEDEKQARRADQVRQAV